MSLLSFGLSIQASAVGRFGIVNMQKVILTVEEGKAARKGLEKEIKSKEIELRKKKAELDKMNRDWKEKSALLSEEARLKKQQEFQERFVELRNSEMAFQTKIKRKEAQATQKIAINVQRIVDTLAKKQALEGVFETNSSGLLYLKDPVDLTNKVIAEYDKAGKKVGLGATSSKSLDLSKRNAKNSALK